MDSKCIYKYLMEDGEGMSSGAMTTDTVEKYAKPVGFKIQKRKKRKPKVIMDEAAKSISVKEIIAALGGEDFYKKTFISPGAAFAYTIKNLSKIMGTFDLSQDDIPLRSLETFLKSIIRERK